MHELLGLKFTFLAKTEDSFPVCASDMPPSTNEVLGGNDWSKG